MSQSQRANKLSRRAAAGLGSQRPGRAALPDLDTSDDFTSTLAFSRCRDKSTLSQSCAVPESAADKSVSSEATLVSSHQASVSFSCPGDLALAAESSKPRYTTGFTKPVGEPTKLAVGTKPTAEPKPTAKLKSAAGPKSAGMSTKLATEPQSTAEPKPDVNRHGRSTRQSSRTARNTRAAGAASKSDGAVASVIPNSSLVHPESGPVSQPISPATSAATDPETDATFLDAVPNLTSSLSCTTSVTTYETSVMISERSAMTSVTSAITSGTSAMTSSTAMVSETSATAAVTAAMTSVAAVPDCPVCLQPLPSAAARTAHLRLCAERRGLGVPQLLAAVRLQQRQAAERAAAGLPTVRTAPTAAAARRGRRQGRRRAAAPSVSGEADLQMALAVSASLRDEEERRRRLTESQLVELGLTEQVEADRDSGAILPPPPELQTDPAAAGESSSRARRGGRRRGGGGPPTVLQLQSTEERQRRLCERVAELLAEEEEVPIERRLKGRPGSPKPTPLWDKSAQLDLNQGDYYVPELVGLVEPCLAPINSLLRDVSEIPGRQNLTQMADSESSDDEEDPASSTQAALRLLAESSASPTQPDSSHETAESRPGPSSETAESRPGPSQRTTESRPGPSRYRTVAEEKPSPLIGLTQKRTNREPAQEVVDKIVVSSSSPSQEAVSDGELDKLKCGQPAKSPKIVKSELDKGCVDEETAIAKLSSDDLLDDKDIIRIASQASCHNTTQKLPANHGTKSKDQSLGCDENMHLEKDELHSIVGNVSHGHHLNSEGTATSAPAPTSPAPSVSVSDEGRPGGASTPLRVPSSPESVSAGSGSPCGSGGAAADGGPCYRGSPGAGELGAALLELLLTGAGPAAAALRCADGPVPVHAAVLAARCPALFRALQAAGGTLAVADVSRATAAALVRLLYLGETGCEAGGASLPQLLLLAERFDLPGLAAHIRTRHGVTEPAVAEVGQPSCQPGRSSPSPPPPAYSPELFDLTGSDGGEAPMEASPARDELRSSPRTSPRRSGARGEEDDEEEVSTPYRRRRRSGSEDICEVFASLPKRRRTGSTPGLSPLRSPAAGVPQSQPRMEPQRSPVRPARPSLDRTPSKAGPGRASAVTPSQRLSAETPPRPTSADSDIEILDEPPMVFTQRVSSPPPARTGERTPERPVCGQDSPLGHASPSREAERVSKAAAEQSPVPRLSDSPAVKSIGSPLGEAADGAGEPAERRLEMSSPASDSSGSSTDRRSVSPGPQSDSGRHESAAPTRPASGHTEPAGGEASSPALTPGTASRGSCLSPEGGGSSVSAVSPARRKLSPDVASQPIPGCSEQSSGPPPAAEAAPEASPQPPAADEEPLEDEAPAVADVWEGFEDGGYIELLEAPPDLGSPLRPSPPRPASTSAPAPGAADRQAVSEETATPGASTRPSLAGSALWSDDSLFVGLQTPASARQPRVPPRTPAGTPLAADAGTPRDSGTAGREGGGGGETPAGPGEGSAGSGSLRTPVNPYRVVLRPSETPVPNYVLMLTPELKRELARIGVKPISRRKAVALLSHIYEETHPVVPGGEKTATESPARVSEPSARRVAKPKSTKARAGDRGVNPPVPAAESGAASGDCRRSPGPERPAAPSRPPGSQRFAAPAPPAADSPPESEPAPGRSDSESSDSESEGPAARLESAFQSLSDEDEITPSQAVCGADLPAVVTSYIRSRPELHRQVLTYEPIWLESLHQDLKRAGVKVKVAQLMDYLDEQCVTFRTEASGRRRKSPKKKRSPKKTSPKKRATAQKKKSPKKKAPD